MEIQKDTYRTLAKPSEVILYKDRKSKFYGYAFPINNESEVKPIIDGLRKQHHTAGHVCYAWQLGTTSISYRANDDGEPNNSAGMPIYGQIKAFELTNVLVAIPRIFGGTKLGVGGLIQAYKTAAQLALENASVITKTIEAAFLVTFDYSEMDKVMRIVKQQHLDVVAQKMELHCELEVRCRKGLEKKVFLLFDELQHVNILRK
ncbi:YigZ family protein [uncultured Croceitalea sp.]|uniref:IMPACT family protein n=1 Tax=uncultured Croceitalea sp. TaxID=1798908 RepID=UPI00330689E8